MLVERRAVEPAKAMGVGREVAGHPVQQHAQSGSVAAVHELREVARAAVAAGRREQPDRLVAPRAIERMLVDGQQLQMGEAEVHGVGDQAIGELGVSEEPVVLAPRPGAEVDLEDADRRTDRLGGTAGGEPGGVGPLEIVDASDHRGVLRPQLGARTQRIGLERQERAVGGTDLVLVDGALAEPGNEDLPDPDAAAPAHRVAAAVPAVEIADHGDPGGVGRPDGEVHPGDAGMLDGMGAQPLPQAAVGALVDQIVVEFAQQRRETVGIVELPGAARVGGAQRVAEPDRAIGDHAFEQASLVPRAQLAHHGAGRLLDHLEPLGTGYQRADDHTAGDLVRPEHRERVAVARLDQRAHSRVGETALRSACHPCPPSPDRSWH